MAGWVESVENDPYRHFATVNWCTAKGLHWSPDVRLHWRPSSKARSLAKQSGHDSAAGSRSQVLW